MNDEGERLFENHIRIEGEVKCPHLYCPICGVKATRTRKPCQHLLFYLEAVFLKEVTINHLHPKLQAAWEELDKSQRGYWDTNVLAFELRLDPRRALLLSISVRTGPGGTDRLEYAVAFEFAAKPTKSKGRERPAAKASSRQR